jgi:hypothetical protein
VLFTYALQRLQLWLPLNPQKLANVTPDSSFNTAISFVSNTNWQGYAGEATMSYLTQMLALAVQNFLSAATGIAVAFALIRGFARHAATASELAHAVTQGDQKRVFGFFCCFNGHRLRHQGFPLTCNIVLDTHFSRA